MTANRESLFLRDERTVEKFGQKHRKYMIERRKRKRSKKETYQHIICRFLRRKGNAKPPRIILHQNLKI